MDFDGREIGRASGQAVGRRALVLDRHIGAADLGALRGRARPRLLDHDVARLELLRQRRRRAEREGTNVRAKIDECFMVRPFRLLAFVPG